MSRKEKFNNWIESIIDDLKSRSDYCYTVNSLEKWHWKQLWEIFDKYIDVNHFGSKEMLEADEAALDEGTTVILEAHDLTDSDLQQEELMDNYLNSSSYPQ